MWPMDRSPRLRRPSCRVASRPWPRSPSSRSSSRPSVRPVAFAGPPPPSTVGPLLQLSPASGRAAASFTAKYWYVDGSGGKCPYTFVEISWAGKLVATDKVDPPDPRTSPTAASRTTSAMHPAAIPGQARRVGRRVLHRHERREAMPGQHARPTDLHRAADADPQAGTRHGSCHRRLHRDLRQWRADLQPPVGPVLLGRQLGRDAASRSIRRPAAPAWTWRMRPTPDGAGSHRMTAQSCDARPATRARARWRPTP